jgi:hypoxanthine phosphoribosyltransferase
MDSRFSEAEIGDAVVRIAREISAAYADTCPVLIGVLKGSFVFLADLIRELTIPFEVDFIRARSYGGAIRSSGAIQITGEVSIDLRDRHVLVVEDIVDTSQTLEMVANRLRTHRPSSVRCCALLVREGAPDPDFWGLRLGRGFVVGYGLDFAERYRGLKDIRALDPSPSPKSSKE